MFEWAIWLCLFICTILMQSVDEENLEKMEEMLTSFLNDVSQVTARLLWMLYLEVEMSVWIWTMGGIVFIIYNVEWVG